jgi:hypothetical protein
VKLLLFAAILLTACAQPSGGGGEGSALGHSPAPSTKQPPPPEHHFPVHKLAPKPSPKPSQPKVATHAAPAYTGAIPDLIRRYFPDDPVALCIAKAESGFDPNAVNGPVAGLWQVRREWAYGIWSNPFAPFDRFDPVIETRFVRWLVDRNGWRDFATAGMCGA